MDYKWIGLEQKWIGSRKLDFLSTLNSSMANKGVTSRKRERDEKKKNFRRKS